MSGYQRQGTFDDLNAALFAQLDRLAGADDDAIEREIERSGAVSQLAARVIDNANTAINLVKLRSAEGMDVAGLVATAPKMLGGGRERELCAPNWEVLDPFIAANAPDHTVGYLVDRLRGQGADVSFESVEQRCRELDVEPNRLTGSREEYAEFKQRLAAEAMGGGYE